MNPSQDTTGYNDINIWNQNIQTSTIDPNTLQKTPPHSHLERSQTDMSMWEDNTAPDEQPWDAGIPSTVNDPAIAADIQSEEVSSSFAAMKIEAGLDAEKQDRNLRRVREYGNSLIISLPLCNLSGINLFNKTHLTQFVG
jgi:hypothetical protein